jgi:hypothetical protein
VGDVRVAVRTFVIRLWTPADEVEAHMRQRCELRGVVEQVGSAEAVPFRSDGELVRLLREKLEGEVAQVGQGERRR